MRSGAKEGDFIVVTGTLGRGAAMLLKNGIYIPKIPAAFAEEAVKAGFIHGMIDVSDGLSSELHHLAKESGLGAFIDIKATPVAPSTKKIALLKKKAVYDMALHGGEDYELLFTVAPKFLRRVLKLGKGKTRLTVLGVMRDKKCGVKYSDVDGELKVLPRKGYDHFA